MGFGNTKYDVEAKGLDPRVAHKELRHDGTLATTLEASQRKIDEEKASRLEEMHAKWVEEQPLESEDVVAALPSEEALAALVAANEDITEEVSQLHNKGIPDVGLDEAGEVVVAEPPAATEPATEEKVVEEPKAVKKAASTKKKTTKK